MVSADHVNVVWCMVSRHLKATPSTWFSPARILLGLTAVLSLMGLFFVFESSLAEAFALVGDQYHFVKLQGGYLVLGWLALFAAHLVPIKVWEKAAPFMYGFGLVLLIMVFIPGIGREINGAYRWLFIGPVRGQPIEFVKLAVTLFFASWMVRHQRLLPFLFLTGVPILLALLQPDLGSSLVMLAIAFTMYFVAGGKLLPFAGVSAAATVLLMILILTSPYRMRRLETFINPELDPLGASFHIRQITLALGSGGWFGQGIGNSRQKFSYIPEASTDSIFAIVAEEVGFVGSLSIILLLVLFIWCGYRIVTQTKHGLFAQLVGMGILTWISTQIILNLAAVVALVPLTGLPLPFFSYGGSSLIMILLATGILLRLSRPPKETTR